MKNELLAILIFISLAILGLLYLPEDKTKTIYLKGSGFWVVNKTDHVLIYSETDTLIIRPKQSLLP